MLHRCDSHSHVWTGDVEPQTHLLTKYHTFTVPLFFMRVHKVHFHCTLLRTSLSPAVFFTTVQSTPMLAYLTPASRNKVAGEMETCYLNRWSVNVRSMCAAMLHACGACACAHLCGLPRRWLEPTGWN